MFVFKWLALRLWGSSRKTKLVLNAADLTDLEGPQTVAAVTAGDLEYTPYSKFVSTDEDVAVKAVLGTFEINCPDIARGTTIALNGEKLTNVKAIDVSIRLGQPVKVSVEFIDKPSEKSLGPSLA